MVESRRSISNSLASNWWSWQSGEHKIYTIASPCRRRRYPTSTHTPPPSPPHYHPHPVQDVQFLAAMGPPGGGRNPVTPRFLRHFNMVAINAFSDETMVRIFSTIISTNMKVSRPMFYHLIPFEVTHIHVYRMFPSSVFRYCDIVKEIADLFRKPQTIVTSPRFVHRSIYRVYSIRVAI